MTPQNQHLCPLPKKALPNSTSDIRLPNPTSAGATSEKLDACTVLECMPGASDGPCIETKEQLNNYLAGRAKMSATEAEEAMAEHKKALEMEIEALEKGNMGQLISNIAHLANHNYDIDADLHQIRLAISQHKDSTATDKQRPQEGTSQPPTTTNSNGKRNSNRTNSVPVSVSPTGRRVTSSQRNSTKNLRDGTAGHSQAAKRRRQRLTRKDELARLDDPPHLDDPVEFVKSEVGLINGGEDENGAKVVATKAGVQTLKDYPHPRPFCALYDIDH